MYNLNPSFFEKFYITFAKVLIVCFSFMELVQAPYALDFDTFFGCGIMLFNMTNKMILFQDCLSLESVESNNFKYISSSLLLKMSRFCFSFVYFRFSHGFKFICHISLTRKIIDTSRQN